MKYIFLTVLMISSQAHSDFFFIKNNKVYSVESKYSPESTGLEKARFLKISVKQNNKNGTMSYKSEGIKSPGALVIEKTTSAPKVVAGEGCAENPMAWLKSSKVLGRLKRKDSSMYIQIPQDVTSFGKTLETCPSGERFAKNALQLSTGNKDFSVLVCADDLNYSLLVFRDKSITADLVITDNCP